MQLSLIKIILIVTILLGIYSCVQSTINEKISEEKLRNEKNHIKLEVKEIVDNDLADIGWEKKLSQGLAARVAPLMTLEIQQVWLTGKPILFVGEVDDIYKSEKNEFHIKVSHFYATGITFLGSDLKVDLACNSDEVVSILNNVKMNFGNIGAGVAVTALIDHIDFSERKDNEGSNIPIHTGIGKCLSLKYIGRNTLN